MRYLSLCSGIEAATVAWQPLGWQPVAFAEIARFPNAVLAHHYPDVRNLGDIAKFREWRDLGPVDLVCGGTPCQSFSIAGLRAGLADPRGNLALTFIAVVDQYRPRWVVWENTLGVLSSHKGRDFGSIVGALGVLGYGWAYRVLDAEYVRVDGLERAVPQRRRRVWLVGCLGDWRGAAAVLSERQSLSGDTPPRRQTGQKAAADTASSLVGSGRGVARVGETRGQDPIVAVRVAPPISARPSAGGGLGTDFDLDGGLIISSTGEVAHCLNAGAMGRIDYESETMIAHALRAEGFDASEDGTGRGIPLVAIPAVAAPISANEQKTYSHGGYNSGGLHNVVPGPIAFDPRQVTSPTNRSNPRPGGPAHALAHGEPPAIAGGWGVRRLTPLECERLMGFPDGYTLVPYRRKLAVDGPRYKALGNSWAVNCARWVGQRIDMVDRLYAELAA